MKHFQRNARRIHRGRQSGMSLIVVMLLLIVVSVLGLGAAQISLMGERSSRNERDAQISWQAAEAALTDAEFDIRKSPSVSNTRSDFFGGVTTPNAAREVNVNNFIVGCGTATGKSKGLCAIQVDGTKPAWLTVDFTSATGGTAAFGDFTERIFNFGTAGIQPSKPPRYVIELIKDTGLTRDLSDNQPRYVFRVTSMGFGPRDDIQSVLQIIYRN